MEARTPARFLFAFVFKLELALQFGTTQKQVRLTQPSKHKCIFICLFFPCDFWSVGNFKVWGVFLNVKECWPPSPQGREQLKFHVFRIMGIASPFTPESALWVDCCNMLVGYPNYSPFIVRFVTLKTMLHSCELYFPGQQRGRESFGF